MPAAEARSAPARGLGIFAGQMEAQSKYAVLRRASEGVFQKPERMSAFAASRGFGETDFA
jgi:hypothetical protein